MAEYTIKLPHITATEHNSGGAELFSELMAMTGDLWAGPAPDLVVSNKSSRRLRAKVEIIARYFRREFHYDFVQYSIEPDESDDDRACVWFGDNYSREIVGVVCFRMRDEGYGLAWAWFHPYERGKGHLTRCWKYLRTRFGPFQVEPPLSPAMVAFLESRCPEAKDFPHIVPGMAG